MKRNRAKYILYIVIVILVGIISKKYRNALPLWIGDYSGDILWALMVFLIFGFIFKGASIIRIAIYAIIFSYLIEFSQLYHVPWIDSIRSTLLGGLVLGYVFLWGDLILYAVGILIGVIGEKKFIF